MESVRVRGCVVETRWTPRASRRQADASRRRNGPRKARPGLVRGRRSRCGLDVSPAPTPPSDAAHGGRRPVVAEKLREPQQAIVGTKTRSAGRTPPMPQCRASRKRMRAKRITGGSHGSCGHGSALRAVGAVSQPRHREALPAREARPPDHPGPGRGRERTQPATARPRREGGADRLLQGPGDPGRGRRRGQDGRARPRRSTRWPPRCAAPPTAAACTTAGTRPVSVGQALADDAARRRQRGRRRDDDRAPGRTDHGHRRRAARGPREVPPGEPDDARPGALRDGAGRPRLLPVRRQGERAPVGRLPPPRLRLRRDLARPRGRPADPPDPIGRRRGWPVRATPTWGNTTRSCPQSDPDVS